MYNIIKINILTIICINDFKEAARRRSRNVNHQATTNLVKAPAGSRITLQLDENTLKFFGQLTIWFVTECGIFVRRDCPMEYHFCKDVPAKVKARMIHRLAVGTINYN